MMPEVNFHTDFFSHENSKLQVGWLIYMYVENELFPQGSEAFIKGTVTVVKGLTAYALNL